MVVFVNGLNNPLDSKKRWTQHGHQKLSEWCCSAELIEFYNDTISEDTLQNAKSKIRNFAKKHPILTLAGAVAMVANPQKSLQFGLNQSQRYLENSAEEKSKLLAPFLKNLMNANPNCRITLIGHSHGGMIVNRTLARLGNGMNLEAIVMGCPEYVNNATNIAEENDSFSLIFHSGPKPKITRFQRRNLFLDSHDLATYVTYLNSLKLQ